MFLARIELASNQHTEHTKMFGLIQHLFGEGKTGIGSSENEQPKVRANFEFDQ